MVALVVTALYGIFTEKVLSTKETFLDTFYFFLFLFFYKKMQSPSVYSSYMTLKELKQFYL